MQATQDGAREFSAAETITGEADQPMNYKERIDPELRRIAQHVPYNKAVIRCANVYQVLSFRLTGVPAGISHKTVALKGYKGLEFQTEIFEPAGRKEALPCLIDVHGGAFSYRAAGYQKKLACAYALRANCRVFFPDYHLAPKHPYPAAYEDVLALYRWITEHAEELCIDREKIGLAGDSAGGSLAALVCNNSEREGLRRPCLQMLIYPSTDLWMRSDSMKRFADAPVWSAKNSERMLQYYCVHLKAEEIDAASPLHNLLPKSIPDTYIETAEYDCLHDEGVLYAEKLRNAGAAVTLNETKGTIHGYDSAFDTRIAQDNLEKRVLFLKKGFYACSAD